MDRNNLVKCFLKKEIDRKPRKLGIFSVVSLDLDLNFVRLLLLFFM
jgi:hypothetical protein